MGRVRTAGCFGLARRYVARALVAATTLLIAAPLSASPARAAFVPPANPPANISPNPPIEGPWTCSQSQDGTMTCTNPCIQHYPQLSVDSSPTCVNAALEAINAARASEGVRPMRLPGNWYSLTIPQQLFVLTDLERTDRGLPPYVAMVNALNQDAQQGAQDGIDPGFSQQFPAFNSASIVAQGPFSPLAADYGWMYDDGWGGAPQNRDCTSPSAPGCWIHRDVILGDGQCMNCLAGAAFSQSTVFGGALAYAEEFAWPVGNGPTPTFSWLNDVLPYLGHPTPANAPPVVGISRTADGGGYWLTDSSGAVYCFGDAEFLGSMAGTALNGLVTSMAPSPDGRGYWLLGTDGGIFSFGDAAFWGSTGALQLNAPVLSMSATPDGGGYWFVARDGGMFAFGNAHYFGSLPGIGVHVGNIVGLVPTGDGQGYWLVGSDGGVFAFGDAAYVGSLPNIGVSVGNIVGIVPTADGLGYWMVGSDGGVFAFGDAPYVGSLPDAGAHVKNIVGIAPTPDNLGYWMVGSDGSVFSFGDANFLGSRR
jgi:hypothetical protein